MSTELVPTIIEPKPPALPGLGDFLSAFLAGRNPRTLRAYAADLADFARFVRVPEAWAAVELLLSRNAGHANALALAYKADLMGRELAAATIARRLAALRSMVKLARQIGRVTWTLEVEGPRSEPYRDTTGPGLDGWRKILTAATLAARSSPLGRRDLAILRLLHDLGLRRGEAVALDLADVDLPTFAVQIVGKGKTEPARVTLSGPARAALADWIAARGDAPGPLFIRLDRAAPGRDRLTGDAVARLVKALGRKAGLAREVRPHGLRHEAITRASTCALATCAASVTSRGMPRSRLSFATTITAGMRPARSPGCWERTVDAEKTDPFSRRLKGKHTEDLMSDSHRDTTGRFTKGGKGGPGRPRRAIETDYLAKLSEAVPLSLWQEIVAKAVEMALEGDHASRSWLAGYLCGKPTGDALAEPCRR